MKLFVAGLPYDLYDDELMEIFEKFGKVLSAKVTLDRETGKSRGFGIVDFENEQDARDARRGEREREDAPVRRELEQDRAANGNAYALH